MKKHISMALALCATTALTACKEDIPPFDLKVAVELAQDGTDITPYLENPVLDIAGKYTPPTGDSFTFHIAEPWAEPVSTTLSGGLYLSETLQPGQETVTFKSDLALAKVKFSSTTHPVKLEAYRKGYGEVFRATPDEAGHVGMLLKPGGYEFRAEVAGLDHHPQLVTLFAGMAVEIPLPSGLADMSISISAPDHAPEQQLIVGLFPAAGSDFEAPLDSRITVTPDTPALFQGYVPGNYRVTVNTPLSNGGIRHSETQTFDVTIPQTGGAAKFELLP